MTPVEFTQNLFSEQVTIPSAGSSVTLATEGYALVGVQMPTAWTAANLGFEISLNATLFQTAYDNSGALLQSVVAASKYVAFPSDQSLFGPYLKVKSVDASNVAVVQAADRVLTLVFRRLFGGY